MKIVECRNLEVKYRVPLDISPRKPLIAFFDRIVKKNYTFWALKDVSFSVDKGDILGIIGASGSGKSTLLGSIGGLCHANKGHIRVDGTVSGLFNWTNGFQTDLSGLKNIYLYGKKVGLKKKELEKIIPSIISLASIDGFIDKPVRMYTRDMYYRLGFAMTTSISRDIMLIDEAMEAGDLEFQQKAAEKIEELSSENQTIVLISHHMETIRKFANKAIWLEDGKIVNQGEPEKITRLYRNF